MKKLLIILLATLSLKASAQWVNVTGTTQKNTSTGQIRWNFGDAGIYLPFMAGFTVTGTPTVGQVITGGSYEDIIRQLFNPSQVPTAGLTGGVVQERVAAGADLSYSLNYSYGRQASTLPIKTDGTGAVLTGASQSYNVYTTAPGAPGSVSGTQAVTVPRNVSNTFTLTVRSTDRTQTATTSFSFYDKRYLGFATAALQGDGTPTDADTRSAVFQDNSGATTTISSYVIATQPSDRYLYFVTTSPVSSVTINGTPSTDTFNLNITRTFVNASGGSRSYYFTVSKNPFGATGSTTVTIN